MKIYTRTGDNGSTSLQGGRRVHKHHPRIEAYGTVDELIAWIGLLRSYPENEKRRDTLIYIQSQLMSCAAALAWDREKPSAGMVLPDAGCVSMLENEIDKMDQQLPSLSSFILPGGNIIVAQCNVARCVCRRAERNVIRLHEKEPAPEIVITFLNRLSDYLFVLGRMIGLELGNEEVKWRL